MRTFCGKRPGNRKSNSSRRSGYQSNLISEPQVHSILQKKTNARLIHRPSQTARTETPNNAMSMSDTS
jgi:hypothetical protein